MAGETQTGGPLGEDDQFVSVETPRDMTPAEELAHYQMQQLQLEGEIHSVGAQIVSLETRGDDLARHSQANLLHIAVLKARAHEN